MDAGTLSASGSWAQAVGSFAGAAAIVYAARTGVATVRSWQGQKSAERQVEAAERILALVYRLEREFLAIRSPAIWNGEQDRARATLIDADIGFNNEPKLTRDRLIQSQVYFDRLADRRDLWNELFACIPLAKAYFGEEADQALVNIWEQRGKIHTAAVMLAGSDLDREFRRSLEGDIWQGVNRARGLEDTISTGIKAAITTLEKRLLPVLRSEGISKSKAPIAD